jgi:hypothetical protein
MADSACGTRLKTGRVEELQRSVEVDVEVDVDATEQVDVMEEEKRRKGMIWKRR